MNKELDSAQVFYFIMFYSIYLFLIGGLSGTEHCTVVGVNSCPILSLSIPMIKICPLYSSGQGLINSTIYLARVRTMKDLHWDSSLWTRI